MPLDITKHKSLRKLNRTSCWLSLSSMSSFHKTYTIRTETTSLISLFGLSTTFTIVTYTEKCKHSIFLVVGLKDILLSNKRNNDLI